MILSGARTFCARLIISYSFSACNSNLFCYNSIVDFRRIIKIISRFVARVVLQVCSLIIRFLPWKYLYVFVNYWAKIGYLFLIKQRHVAFRSLSIAFGQEKQPEELKKIAKDCFTSIVKSGVEVVFFRDKPELIKSQVVIENRQILDNALAKGKGVIIVTGHFGNFPLMMLRLAVEGYPIVGIMRPMRDQRMQNIFIKEKYLRGMKLLYSQPRKACIEAAIRSLRNNKIVVIQLDQNFGTGGFFVDFFGQKAATAAGPVVFALRTKAIILPCFILRQDDDTHRIFFEKEFNIKREEEFNKMLLVNVQRLTEIIESYIRRYPAHWSWMHRRWKTRPKAT